ncbi:hypothetical protein AV530_008018 [Patagioenas fasciata monilis]|uniref:Uncharacterized protein n=1 Tax=Patagioenas fasciata monilis TaxID=372326 RepID=A0A1V4KU47_PATFA|nr:hypothetical protein AV530_008018 [Patagioenas fasciata monilis]
MEMGPSRVPPGSPRTGRMQKILGSDSQISRSRVRSCHCPSSAGHRHEWVRPTQAGWTEKCKAAGDVPGKD